MEDENEKKPAHITLGAVKRPPSLKKRFIILGCISALVIAVLVLLFIDNGRYADTILRKFRYTGEQTLSEYCAYDNNSSNTFAALDQGLAVAGGNGLSIYGKGSEELSIVQTMMQKPAVISNGEAALAYDIGGSGLLITDTKGKIQYQNRIEGTIYDADLSADGYCSITAAETGYKSVLLVMDTNQKEFYKLLSSTRYLGLCAVSSGGTYVAAVAVDYADNSFSSTAVIYRTNEQEPVAEIPLGNQTVYDIKYVNSNTFCAVGQSETLLYTMGDESPKTVSYGDEVLTDFSLNGNGFITLILNKYKTGGSCSAATYDYSGKSIGSLYLGEEVSGVSVAGKYIAVLTGSSLKIYGKKLELWHEVTEIGGVLKAFIRSNGTALLVGSKDAKLYIP